MIPIISVIIYLMIMGIYIMWSAYDGMLSRRRYLDMEDRIKIAIWFTAIWLLVTGIIILIAMGGLEKLFGKN